MKIIAILLAVVMSMAFTSCGGKSNPVEGETEIRAIQAVYKSLDSGRLVVSDVNTGEIITEFSFEYLDNVLKYSTKTTLNGNEYLEYNDGNSLRVLQDGKNMEFKWPNKNFQKYTRKKTHPNADTGIFFFEPKRIESAEISTNNGIKEIFYQYDMEKLAKAMPMETSAGELTRFTTTFFFENDDYQYLLEESTFGNGDVHCYKVEVLDENSTKVVNPIK